MAFMTVRLTPPGVHVEQTPTLLQASIAKSNLIRFRDGLPEKIGGWRRYLSYAIPGPVRQLWPWVDANGKNHVGVGGDQGLAVITDNVWNDISPLYSVSNIAPNFSTTAGSPLVVVNDPGGDTNTHGSVVIAPSVSVGGLILQGSYAVTQTFSGTQYEITAAANATSMVTNGGAVPAFTTQAGSELVNVNLPNHGLVVGGVYVCGVPTQVGGVTIGGVYDVLKVVDANNFTIAANSQATSNATVSENGGDVQITYYLVNTPPAAGSGWGTGGWGVGGWGTGLPPPPISGTKLTAPDWSLGNFGENLLAAPLNGPLFAWDPDSGLQQARPIPNAPAQCAGFFVAMPQQQIVVYGASSLGVQDPMLVAWSDNGDYNTWTAAVSNQAGSYRLTRGSKIVAGIQGPQQAMLWTDVGLWLQTYIGYPDVWGFAEVAQGCGPICKNAIAVTGGAVFWMALDKFWMFANGAAQPLPCEVWDAVMQNLNPGFIDHIRAGANSTFAEVIWFYPSTASTGENDSYVKFNMMTSEWDYGSLAVSEWVDLSTVGPPLSAMTRADGQSSLIMQHETGYDADTLPIDWWFETGFFQLAEAEQFIFVDRLYPDFKWRRFDQPQSASSVVQITLKTQDEPDNPNKPPDVYGPFSVTNSSGPVDPRARGRYFSLKIEGNDLGSFTRLGAVKFRFAPDGRQG